MSLPGTELNVSRETQERLELFAALLMKWNPKINLVSRASLDDLWSRHILDSVQVFRLHSGGFKNWVDLGSGGGFPGLVIAILSAETSELGKITLVEGDQRKAVFLRTVLRETGISANVISERIEKISPLGSDVLSARALADLSLLFEFAERHLSPYGTALFPKGRNWKKELQNARSSWNFDYEYIPSLTDSESAILKIKGLSRV